ncbi:AI-2E family transporter [Brevibacterium sp. BRM-1]|uniref:AI-2E family transporter n=1 Tax=Brevibacterium sp. BRM-1 TaxID=2999062 RepID=UPI00227E7332|nr:AI-2E family transporter [Brevibacterium sp. BRM-1]WAL41146.1 AI-2E family transporter [Brevibacterium sp. BRM-1]
MSAGAAQAPAPAAHGDRPESGARWPRFLVVVLGIAGLAFALQFFRGLQDIVAPVFLAVNLVIVVYPVQRWLVARRVPAFVAAMVTVVLVLVLVVGFFGLTAWSIAQFVTVLPGYSQKISVLYGQAVQALGQLGITPDLVGRQLSGLSFTSIFNAAMSLAQNLSLGLSLMVTAVMAVFFVALDSMSFPQRMARAGILRPRFAAALTSFGAGVRRYWVVATIFGLIVAVLDVAALYVIGVPLAIVWGILSFLTNYIPNIGFVLGVIPPALMALVDGGWADAVWVIVAYSVLNFVIQSIIQPKFTGESVGVTPFVSFVSLLFWYWVLGWLGALLALPATLLLKALLVDADPRASWVNLLIASDPPEAPVAPGRSGTGTAAEADAEPPVGARVEAPAARVTEATSTAAEGSGAAGAPTGGTTGDSTPASGPAAEARGTQAPRAGEPRAGASGEHGDPDAPAGSAQPGRADQGS